MEFCWYIYHLIVHIPRPKLGSKMGSTFNIEIYEEDVKKYSSQEPQAINCEM